MLLRMDHFKFSYVRLLDYAFWCINANITLILQLTEVDPKPHSDQIRRCGEDASPLTHLNEGRASGL